MTEEWRPVPGFIGYEVSDHGRVRSLWNNRHGLNPNKPRVLKLWADSKGRKTCVLGRTDKHSWTNRMRVAPLVLLAFVGPGFPGAVCMHLDDNPANDHLPNLRWGTSSENNQQMWDARRVLL